ncbi:MAG: hypothetical protein LBS57_07995 [Treponema sp.]|jgi:hypothetical protein|nr:hypothetical protein [Treponema sp.]
MRKNRNDLANKSLEIAARINKALDITGNKEEIAALRQRKKKLDRISFTHVKISDEVFKMLEKNTDMEKPNSEHDYLICMHCKVLVNTMVYEISPNLTGQQ